MEGIRIIFILPDKYSNENEASRIIRDAYEACKQNVDSDVRWVKEKGFSSLSPTNKTDFIVFEEFEGKLFNELKKTKSARILGPWAVSACLMEAKAIPNFPWPIYNIAMYDCVVTCSHLAKSLKMEIKEKIELMGGCYVDTLVTKNTHLITGSAKSEKYLMAAEAGVKLMCSSWVDDVWKSCQNCYVHADDEQFRKHRCLSFQNLTISSTGLSAAERKKAEKIIVENGGTFTGKLNLKETDILICSGEGCTTSEKYKHARKEKHIKCVNLQWIFDSVDKGYALPHINYQVQKMTSTPTKPDDHVNPEFSVLSAIGGSNYSQRAFIEETIGAPFSPVGDRHGNKRKAAVTDLGELVDSLDIKKAKKAGQYLDGCSVYITGFNSEQFEKLNKIINSSGATRYDTYSDRVTHVIVGDAACHEVKLLRNKCIPSVIVSIQWLIDSIEQKRSVNEDQYLLSFSELDKTEMRSPLSKKGLNLLRSSRTVTEKEIEATIDGSGLNAEGKPEGDIVHQYLKPDDFTEEDTLAKLLEGAQTTSFAKQISNPPRQTRPAEQLTQESSVSITQNGSEDTQFFANVKFLVLGFIEEEYDGLKEQIENFSGEIVPKYYKGIPDYAVVPIFNRIQIRHTVSEVVNNLFVNDCELNRELLQEILYYHRPFDLPSTKPLQNFVVTLSSYSGYEKVFLRGLIDGLGGIAQELFARVPSEAKRVLPSTHLVSFEASGRKYEAALKWGLPVVNKDWLLECARTGSFVEEANYLVGEAKAPERAKEPTPSKKAADSRCNTPTAISGPSRVSKILTPVNHVTPLHKKFLDSAEKPFSQVTPVNKIMERFRESSLMHASLPKETKEYTIPKPWMNIKTPETPLGAFLTPNPSPGLRKQWEYWLQQFPDRDSPKSTASTPLSEIRKKLWDKVFRRGDVGSLNFDEAEIDVNDENMEKANTQEDSCPATPENQQLASRLQQLEDMLTDSGGKRHSRPFHTTIPAQAVNTEYKDSQPCTVGWDYQEQEAPKVQMKIFMLSGIIDGNVKTSMVQQIESLGALVSDLSNYDPSCTHLLCPKPARNEKMLSCVAGGKWILHVSYLEHSFKAGHFMNEEEYEFGNPKSLEKFTVSPDRDTELRIQRMFWWRREISKRGYGAFNDMRAIIVAQKREPIVRVIEAGGGTVIDVRPPFEDTVHATHCLLEQRSVQDFSSYIPLAKQGIYLVNTVFISDYLQQPTKDIRDCILPYFSKYYARS